MVSSSDLAKPCFQGAHGSRPGNQHRVGGTRARVSAVGARTTASLRDFDALDSLEDHPLDRK